LQLAEALFGNPFSTGVMYFLSREEMSVANASVSLPSGRLGNAFTTIAFYEKECS